MSRWLAWLLPNVEGRDHGGDNGHDNGAASAGESDAERRYEAAKARAVMRIAEAEEVARRARAAATASRNYLANQIADREERA